MGIQIAKTTGLQLYAVVRKPDGTVWKTTESQFVNYVSSDLANYIISLAEQGVSSAYYVGIFPNTSDGAYYVAVYQSGGSPAEGDTLIGMLGITVASAVIASIGVLTLTGVGS